MDQLPLFETPAQRPPKFNLFLAVFPDTATAQCIYKLAAEVREKHGLKGKLRPLDHLHVTVHHLGHYAEVPEKHVHAATRACEKAAIGTPALAITFDRMLSFRGRAGKSPLVLAGAEDGNTELKGFHQALGLELLKQRLPMDKKLTPHVTLLYDREIPEEPVDPVSWRVHEIVLVLSHMGMTKYDQLRRLTLGG